MYLNCGKYYVVYVTCTRHVMPGTFHVIPGSGHMIPPACHGKLD